MYLIRRLCALLFILLITTGLVYSQDQCPATVDDAVFALSDVCTTVGRNEACYGNGQVVAVPFGNAVLDFDAPGDLAVLNDIDSLTLQPFINSLDEWGIAILVVQANIPDTLPGQNVTMLLFGDTNFVNDSGAYYFTSGIGTPTCEQAPDGMLIQTPEGFGEVTLTMNGVDIRLGSTAYLTTLEEDSFTFALLEGNATLEAGDASLEVAGEEYTTVTLDEEGNATGEFTEPAPVEELDLPELPLSVLPEPIDDAEATDTATSGDAIVPLSGDWVITIGDIVFDGTCPAVLDAESVRQGLSSFGFGMSTTQTLEFGDEFNLESIFSTPEMEAAGLVYTVGNPEPNVYTVDFDIEGAGSVQYTWRLLSETSIEAQVFQNLVIPDLADCNITTTISFEYAG